MKLCGYHKVFYKCIQSKWLVLLNLNGIVDYNLRWPHNFAETCGSVLNIHIYSIIHKVAPVRPHTWQVTQWTHQDEQSKKTVSHFLADKTQAGSQSKETALRAEEGSDELLPRGGSRLRAVLHVWYRVTDVSCRRRGDSKRNHLI